MDGNYSVLRQEAIAWLKSKRDFNKGIEILQRAAFKPAVVNVLRKHGPNGPAAQDRLEYHVRTFIKVWFDKTLSEDTDVEMGVVKGEQVATVKRTPMMSKEMEDKMETLPPSVSDVVRKYRDAYVQRDVAFRKMQDLPEDNTEDTVAKRKAYSDVIEEKTNLLDKLYPMYKAYVDEGKVPDANELKVQEKQKRNLLEPGLKKMDTMNKKQLRKLRKSIATKIARAKNMLDFQTETKGTQLNPMPSGKNRVKYESKILRLQGELEKVELEIAKRA